MIAPRPSPQSARRRRYALSPAVTFLIRAFAPGCPTLLRSQATKAVRGGSRLTINYDLPDSQARLRADELARSAASLKLIAVGRQVVRDVDVTIGEVLTVSVLLVGRGR
jgi:hypothetical protein